MMIAIFSLPRRQPSARQPGSRVRLSTSGYLLLCVSAAFASLGPCRAADFYVSPQGSDGSSGGKGSPFATLERAQNAVRQSRAQHPDEAVTVWLGGGEYRLTKPVSLTRADSGTPTAPVCYRATLGEVPRLTNARHLAAADFRPVTAPTALARIAPAAKGKIVELDLKAIGARHTQAPPPVFEDTGHLPDLYLNGQRMTLSRYPKTGGMKVKTVLRNGDAKGDAGIFEYREGDYGEFERWAKVLDRRLWLKGYWRVMWSNPALQVRAIDTTAHTVTFAVGVSNGIGNKYHRPAGDGREEYWALNLLEEVTQPGEWALDYQDQKLYFYPPAGLADAQIYLGDAEQPMLELTDVSNVTVRGITFEHALGDAVVIRGGDSDTVAGCTVRNVDQYAVRLEGGTRHTVLSCDLYHLGVGGVWLSGGDDSATPHQSAGHRVINNHIHHFSELVKVYAPAVNCGYIGASAHYNCVGMLVAHNLIHDTPHAGILFGSWDNVFEYNEVFRYCLVSNDLGAFYAYSRYDQMGNDTFRYNLMHGSAQGDGIYFDLDHCEMHVYSNVAFLQSRGSKGSAYLYKVGTQTNPKYTRDPADAQPIDCHDNIAVQSRLGYAFVVPGGAGSRIENNVSFDCLSPWSFTSLQDGKATPDKDHPLEKLNRSYAQNPGFVDPEHFDFRCKADAQVLKDLPGFQPIPVAKVGLYLDEYRASLPSAEEIDRYSEHTSIGGPAYGVEDRK